MYFANARAVLYLTRIARDERERGEGRSWTAPVRMQSPPDDPSILAGALSDAAQATVAADGLRFECAGSPSDFGAVVAKRLKPKLKFQKPTQHRSLRGIGVWNIAFDYRIVARRRGYEAIRMPQVPERRTLETLRPPLRRAPSQPKVDPAMIPAIVPATVWPVPATPVKRIESALRLVKRLSDALVSTPERACQGIQLCGPSIGPFL